jgi:glycosyltransferase involved in cell wall biosynthesis
MLSWKRTGDVVENRSGHELDREGFTPLLPGRSPTLGDRRRPDVMPTRRISALALVPYPVGRVPSQRFRLEQWRPFLEGSGISLEFQSFADERVMQSLHRSGQPLQKAWYLLAASLRRFDVLRAASQHDVVIIHRALCIVGPAVLERLLASVGPPIIFDFDDSIFLTHTAAANRLFGWLKFPGKTATLCRLSRHVVVGNAHLAEYARRHNPRVTVVPTSIDVDAYQPRPPRPPGQRVVVGWTGSSTSQTYLEAFVPTLRALLAVRDVELRVISDRPPVLDGVPHTWEPWSASTEAERVADFDIGIMPMPDDIWSRGKCAAKALQCMAAGVATVASAIGANREVIASGRNGLLAATETEWLEHLRNLIDDAILRRRLAEAGRQTVLEHFSGRRSASALAQVILDVANGA